MQIIKSGDKVGYQALQISPTGKIYQDISVTREQAIDNVLYQIAGDIKDTKFERQWLEDYVPY